MRNSMIVLAVSGLLAVICPSSLLSAEPVKDENAALAGANNAFALDVYRQLKSRKGNIFFSPFSIMSAVGMTGEGARGRTAEQMMKTMHLDRLSDAERRSAYRSYSGRVSGGGQKPYRLSIANDLWCQQGYQLKEEFLAAIKENYNGNAQLLAFEMEPDASRLTINKAVEKETNGKIKDLLSPGTVSPFTRLVLTNAIYFYGEWQNVFDKQDTRQDSFHLANGGEANVATMHQTESFDYLDTDRAQLLRMGYKGDDLSMVVLLPKERDGLKELEESLTAEKLDRWLKALRETGEKQRVVLSLPKFKAANKFSVNETLQSLGMTDAFAIISADFSGITGKRDLYITDVTHKAVCAVDEKGTEAAAASAVMCEITCMRPAVKFNADHPFMYLIVDNRSDMILFAGRMENPSAEE